MLVTVSVSATVSVGIALLLAWLDGCLVSWFVGGRVAIMIQICNGQLLHPHLQFVYTCPALFAVLLGTVSSCTCQRVCCALLFLFFFCVLPCQQLEKCCTKCTPHPVPSSQIPLYSPTSTSSQSNSPTFSPAVVINQKLFTPSDGCATWF